MANVKIYACDTSFITYTMSATENISYPLANLNAYMPDITYWKSSSSANAQSLKIDAPVVAGNTAGKTFVAVDGHNFAAIVSAGGQVKIQYAADSGFTTSVVTVFDTATDTVNNSLVVEFASTTRRYFRIYYVTTGGVTPQVGLFWLGNIMDFGYPYNFNSKTGNSEYVTDEEAAIDGRLRSSQIFKGRKKWEIDYVLLPTTTKDTFRLTFDTARGKLYPVYYCDPSSVLYFVKFCDDYIPPEEFRNNVNNIRTFTLRSVLVS